MALRSVAGAVDKALAEAEHPSQDYHNACDHFVGLCYGLAHSGYTSAIAHWKQIPQAHKHKGTPATGGVPFWDIGTHGHTAIAVSDGMIASNDIVKDGKISVVRVGLVAEKWHHATYLGWADPFYHGSTVSIGVQSKKTATGQPSAAATGVTVSLARMVKAARDDPPAADTHLTDKAGTLTVERGLAAEGLLDKKFVDGHFGTKTVEAYAGWQRRLHFSGADADGIPGIKTLTALGARHGFAVVA